MHIKKILKIKQWLKRAHAAPNRVVGPLCHIFTLGECMIECFNIMKNYTPYKSIQDFF